MAETTVAPSVAASQSNLKSSGELLKEQRKRSAREKMNNDVQQYMNIHHFEELMRIFQEEKREDSSGFDIDKFREVFGKVFRGALNDDQLNMLFMKIDANSDGTVDWDEFSTYMMMGTINSEEKFTVYDEKSEQFQTLPEIPHPHRDMIKKVEFIPKERKYMSISRDGVVCIWGSNFRLQRQIDTKEFTPTMSWVSDATCLYDQGKLATACDDRKIYLYDIFTIKPRLLAVIGPLENAPLCISYSSKYDENQDLLIWGDDGGYVSILFLTKRFFVDHVTEDKPAFVDPTILLKREGQNKYHLSFQKRRTHDDWVYNVQYYSELNGYVSCSSDSNKSLAIGDIERRTVRHLHVQRGIKHFDFCRRPSFLVTGGRDKIIRLWNPYVLSKPAGSLVGHNTTISKIAMNYEFSHIISLSEDKVIKIWNARNLQCLQTLVDKVYHRPENVITAITFDNYNRKLILGHDFVEAYEPHRRTKLTIAQSHDGPVVAAMYNESFHQVVSGCTDSTVRVWNVNNGEKTFQFNEAHGKLEITCMTFDTTRRRLLTASRDGVIRLWNFNNGQMLQQMRTSAKTEITQMIHVETPSNKLIVCVGWDRKITFFQDDPGNYSSEPLRELCALENKAMLLKGHHDDLLSLDYLLPNTLVTGGLDGLIAVWNADSGHCRAILKDPFLHLRGPEEKGVEKVMFLYPRNGAEIDPNPPLLSISSDGYMRFWDISRNKLLHEIACHNTGQEGVTSFILSADADLLVVGDTDGIARVFTLRLKELEKSNPDMMEFCELVHIWKAHLKPVTQLVHLNKSYNSITFQSVEYIKNSELILTSSKDGSIRVWTKDGKHVGIFGSDEGWDLSESLTYAPCPSDVVDLQTIEKTIPAKAAMIERQMRMKDMVIRKFKIGRLGINPDMLELVELELQQKLNTSVVDFELVKERAMQKATAAKWRAFIANKNKHTSTARSNYDLYTSNTGKDFFTYRAKAKSSASKKSMNVKAESAFHSLPYHELTELITPTKPTGLERAFKEKREANANKLFAVTNAVAVHRRDDKAQNGQATLPQLATPSVHAGNSSANSSGSSPGANGADSEGKKLNAVKKVAAT